MLIQNFALVCAGGALGAGARFLVNTAALQMMGPGFPWGTWLVNIAGSFLMGLVAQYVLMRTGLSLGAKLFLMTGVLGGFTTFSAFALDVGLLVERDEMLAAASYVITSVSGAILALFAGQWVMRSVLG